MKFEPKSLCPVCNKAFCKADCLPCDPAIETPADPEKIAEWVKIKTRSVGI